MDNESKSAPATTRDKQLYKLYHMAILAHQKTNNHNPTNIHRASGSEKYYAGIRLTRLTTADFTREKIRSMTAIDIQTTYENKFNAMLNLQSCELIKMAAQFSTTEEWNEFHKVL